MYPGKPNTPYSRISHVLANVVLVQTPQVDIRRDLCHFYFPKKRKDNRADHLFGVGETIGRDSTPQI